MKKKLSAILATFALALGILASPAQAATVTEYSVSTAGWSSGWHSVVWGIPYNDYYVTSTYSGTSSCNSSSDHALVESLDYDSSVGTVVVGSRSVYGAETSDSWTSTYHVSTSAYFHSREDQTLRWYVGPQSACHLTISVWQYA